MLGLSLWVSSVIVAPFAVAGETDAAVQAPAASSKLYDLMLTRIDGTSFPAADLKGKAVLFVNVASRCGFTPQYEALEAIYERYKARGLEIVGQPCNQFLWQEPASNDEIQTFCSMKYGVTFTLLAKADVNGKSRTPLYAFLVGDDADISWNFEKFVVSPEGEVTARFPPATTPDDPAVIQAIEAALPTRAPSL